MLMHKVTALFVKIDTKTIQLHFDNIFNISNSQNVVT